MTARFSKVILVPAFYFKYFFHVSTFTNTFQGLFVQALCLISFHWPVIYLHSGLPAAQDHKAGDMFSRTHKHTHTQTHTHRAVQKNKLCWVRLPVTPTVKTLISAICRASLQWRHPGILRKWQADQHLVTSTGCITSPSTEHNKTLSDAQAHTFI